MRSGVGSSAILSFFSERASASDSILCVFLLLFLNLFSRQRGVLLILISLVVTDVPEGKNEGVIQSIIRNSTGLAINRFNPRKYPVQRSWASPRSSVKPPSITAA
jgi:hypothetical protein